MGADQAWSKAWWAEKLIIPVFVGLAIFIVQFIVPTFLVKDKELSIQLPSSSENISSPDSKSASNQNKNTGSVVNNSILYHVKVKNSGALPLKNVPVLFLFEHTDSNFQVIRINHNTLPQYEFGPIKDEEPNYDQRRFIYSLLNPGDEDLIEIQVNREMHIKPYAKSEGMVLKIISSSKSITQKPKDELRTSGLTRMMSFSKAFFFGVLGAMLFELVSVLNLLLNRRRASELPIWLTSPFYWIITCVMTLTGGFLVAAYFASGISVSSPLIALNLGASAPLIIQHLSSQLPRMEPGKIND